MIGHIHVVAFLFGSLECLFYDIRKSRIHRFRPGYGFEVGFRDDAVFKLRRHLLPRAERDSAYEGDFDELLFRETPHKGRCHGATVASCLAGFSNRPKQRIEIVALDAPTAAGFQLIQREASFALPAVESRPANAQLLGCLGKGQPMFYHGAQCNLAERRVATGEQLFFR